MGGRPDLQRQLGYPGYPSMSSSLPPALAQQLGSLRGRGLPQASQASQRLSTMTPDGCVLWEVQLTKSAPGDRRGRPEHGDGRAARRGNARGSRGSKGRGGHSE
eukprot:g7962.t1